MVLSKTIDNLSICTLISQGSYSKEWSLEPDIHKNTSYFRETKVWVTLINTFILHLFAKNGIAV